MIVASRGEFSARQIPAVSFWVDVGHSHSMALRSLEIIQGEDVEVGLQTVESAVIGHKGRCPVDQSGRHMECIGGADVEAGPQLCCTTCAEGPTLLWKGMGQAGGLW